MALLYRTRTLWGANLATGGGVTTLHFLAIGETSQDGAQDVLDSTLSLWISLAAALPTNSGSTVSSLVEVIEDSSGELVEEWNGNGGAVPGSNAGELLPKTNQGLISWRTGTILQGRRIRGRTFIPGPLETDSAGGVPTASYRNVLAAGGNDFITTPAGVSPPAIWARPKRDTPGGPIVRPGTNGLITGFTVAGYWAVLRSRRD